MEKSMLRTMREKMKHGAGKSGDGTESGLRRMKKAAGRTGAGILAQIRRWEERPFLFSIGLGLFLYLIVEMLSRRSVIAGIGYLVQHPLLFLYNSLIVIVTLSSGPSVPEKGIRLCAGIADLAGTGHYKLCSAGIQDDSAECNGFQNV